MFTAQLTTLRGRRRDESGAIAMILALLLTTGALMGVAALSIDVGALYAQRRQVQNGADAAALALAQTCAREAARCNSSMVPSLASLAGLNGRTTLGDVTATPPYPQGICVRNLGTSTDLPTCATPTGTLVDCPAVPTTMATTPYLEVHTQTLVSGGHLLPPIVAQSLGYGGGNVVACARAAIAVPGAGRTTTFPLTMSYCDWKNAVGWVSAAQPGTFQAAPKGAWPGYGASNPWPAAETTVNTAKDDTDTCPTWNGHTAPGGFSWLQTTTDCSANVSGGWVIGVPGNNYLCNLTPYRGKLVALPIFDCLSLAPVTITPTTDCTSAHGTATSYHIVGYAPFYVSGWQFSGSTQNSVRPPNQPPSCPGTGNSGRCLSGWFTHAVLNDLPPADPGDTTPGFGGYVVLPAG